MSRGFGSADPKLEITSDLGARKLGGEDVVLHVVYEAGPTGYVIYRRLQQLKIECIVVAPSRTPQPKGVRQKNDRRDAVQLARLYRAGELTGINVPDAVDESIRDLTRARADCIPEIGVSREFRSAPTKDLLRFMASTVGPAKGRRR